MEKNSCRKEKMGYLIYDLSCQKYIIKEKIESDIPYRMIEHHRDYENVLSAPLTIFMELTKQCNLNCKHCFRDNNDSKNLCTDDWFYIIDQLYDYGVCSVKITGGEPFLRTDLKNILQYLDHYAIDYIVFTNGFFIEDNIDWLKELTHLKCIRVSIDGTEKINDIIRGAGSWERAISSIFLLEKHCIPCEINYTITKQNYKDLPGLSKELRKRGINSIIHTGFIKYAGNAKENIEQCFISNQEIYQVSHVIKNYQKVYSNISDLYLLKPIYYEIFRSTYGCPAGRISMTIKQDGTVIPCGILPKNTFTCGNIISDGLYAVWNNSTMLSLNGIDVHKQCETCKHLFINCTGGCRGNAFNYFNQLDEEDINCSVYQVFCD